MPRFFGKKKSKHQAETAAPTSLGDGKGLNCSVDSEQLGTSTASALSMKPHASMKPGGDVASAAALSFSTVEEEGGVTGEILLRSGERGPPKLPKMQREFRPPLDLDAYTRLLEREPGTLMEKFHGTRKPSKFYFRLNLATFEIMWGPAGGRPVGSGAFPCWKREGREGGD